MVQKIAPCCYLLLTKKKGFFMEEKNEVFEEPANQADNSETQDNNEGQASAPSEELILGKFKSVDDLAGAYRELEKHQGNQSAELGDLRQKTAFLGNIKEAWEKERQIREKGEELQKAAEKYNTYFQDPTFREIYKQAYLALGKNLDSDKLVNLIEGYVSSRIFAHDRNRAAGSETQKITDGMTFSENKVSSLTPPKKRLDEMTSKEVDELLDKLI